MHNVPTANSAAISNALRIFFFITCFAHCRIKTVSTSTSDMVCEDCTVGRYSIRGTAECTECESGKYSTVTKAVGCVLATTCGAGTGIKTMSSTTSDTVCEDCTAGRYSIGGTVGCTECESGKYTTTTKAVGCTLATTCGVGKYIKSPSTATTDTECEVCTKGSASAGDQVACTLCDGKGVYSDEDGATACKLAPAGHKPNANRDGIEVCPKNSFSIGASDDCIVCTDGGHSRPGSSACEKCSAGEYYNDAEIKCDLCPKNTFTISGAPDFSGCTPCTNAGEYAPPGSGYCRSCTSGTYYDDNETTCLDCPSGTFTATGGVGIEQCEKCPEGFYSSSPGSSTCFACDAGKYANAEQKECVTCAVGKISGVASPSCTVCENGKFAEGEGNVECSFCDTEEVLKGSITATNGTSSELGCICPKGKFKDHATATCEAVPEGVRKDVEGMNVTSQSLKPGYWRTSAASRNIYMCLSLDHCIGGSDIKEQCKEGHKGPKCGVCSDGFASTGSGETLKCNRCEGGNATQTILIYFSAFAMVIVLVVMATCCCKKKKETADEVRLTSEDGLDEGRTKQKKSSAARANKTLGRADQVLSGIQEVSALCRAWVLLYAANISLSLSLSLSFFIRRNHL